MAETSAYEPIIAGKRVTFKRRLPLRTHGALVDNLAKAQSGNIKTLIPVLAGVVESWEFAGDPTDPEAYQDLDVFEVVALGKALDAYAEARMANQPSPKA